jgi:NitT/TauT family transport system ATP-binding protein
MIAQHVNFDRAQNADRGRGATLDLSGVSCAFARDGRCLTALERVNLRVAPGELVAVLGPRGSGKSTLLRMIAGHEAASTGAVLINGEAASTAPHLVLTRYPNFPASKTAQALAAAAWRPGRGAADATRAADQALRLMGLQRFAGAHSRELTAGTAQRVSLATALVNDPQLLLLDDPFVRLDPITRAAIQGELVSLWQRCGFTALFATSDVDEALRVARRIIVLGGRPARIVLDLAQDCGFPRRGDDPHLAAARAAVRQALDCATAEPDDDAFAARHAVASALGMMVWAGNEPVVA